MKLKWPRLWRLAALLLVLSPAQAESVVSAEVMQLLAKQVRADVPEMRSCTPERGLPIVAKALDLNGDGEPEYLLTSVSECECGQVNCSQWIYRRSQNRFELILESQGYLLSARSTSHHGYRDVESTSRNNAATVNRVRHVFNGRVYEETGSTMENPESGRTKPARRRRAFAER